MTRFSRLPILAGVLLAASLWLPPSAAQAQAAAAKAGLLTIDSLIDIKFPSSPVFAPDGRTIAFLWERAGVQEVWTVPAAGGAPVQVTHDSAGLMDALFWSPDGRTIYFARDGALWQVPGRGGAATRVWTGEDEGGGFAISPDGRAVAFTRQGDLYVRPLAGGAVRRLTRGPADASGPQWSPDGSRLLFTMAKETRHEDAPAFSGSKILFTRTETADGVVAVVPVRGGSVVPLAPGGGDAGSPSWIDRTHVVFQRISDDVHTRTIVVADVLTGHGRTVEQDVDPKWWDLLYVSSAPQPSPDGKWLAFLSDRDGWAHLYVVPVAGGAPVQVTRGHFEVDRPSWAPDSKRLIFDANVVNAPGRREITMATLDKGRAPAAVDAITATGGTNTAAIWSPDASRIVFEHTDAHHPADLDSLAIAGRARPVPLTDSLPASVDRQALVAPRFVHYKAPDGTEVPAWLFVPATLDRSHSHPAIIWVHGDGINQNYDGWHIHRDYGVYYSFHQYLVQHGYVVLAVDYRGSIGYGRAWREAVFHDLGGKDFSDVAAGATYLKSLGFVDPQRIGIWGLSYGGFLTLQAVTETPTLFNCAVDVAGVEDWKDWYQDPGGAWIRGRMGRPQDNPDLYRRTSPIYRVDQIVRPLLVLAGTADVNVPFIESARLMDALLKAHKTVDFMMYPGEFHYFERAHVLRDAWQRVAAFFDAHLHPER
ncbi:MAG TPA: S9 family peptidase [Vicinamibacterales bacterium]